MQSALAAGGMSGVFCVTTGFSKSKHIGNQKEVKIWGKLTKLSRIKWNRNNHKGLNLGSKCQNNKEMFAITLETDLFID